MIITKIKLNNFLSYYGEIEFDFSKGRNIVLAENNIGKSNLFNAFYWALFGDIFDKSKGQINVDLNKNVALVNKMSIEEAESKELKEILCSVQLNIDEYQNDTDLWEEIEIKRHVDLYKQDNEWLMSSSYLEIEYYLNRNKEVFTNKEVVLLKITDMFPANIRPYIWFQGEDIDKLIDLAKGRDFRDAIKSISYFPKYEQLESNAKNALNYVTKVKEKKEKKQESGNIEFERFQRKIDVKRKELEKEEKRLFDYEQRLVDVKSVISDLENKLDVFDDFQEIDKQRTQYKTEKEKWSTIQKEIESRQSKLFKSKWILKGIGTLVKDADSHIREYEKELNNGAVTIEVPDKAFLEKCIAENECLVCGSDGNTILKIIKDRLVSQEEAFKRKDKNQILNNNLIRLFSFKNEIQREVVTISDEMTRIDDEKEESLKQFIKASKLHQEADQRINNLAEKNGITVGVAIKQNKDNKAGYQTHTRNKSTYETTIQSLKFNIKRITSELEELKAKKAKSFKSNVSEIVEIEIEKVLLKMFKAISNVKDKELDRLLESVESRANKQFRKMTDHNKSITGKITINRVSYEIDLLDKNDERVIYSTGYKSILKMCIINAIIKLNEEISTSYPFISDAPTSSLSPKHSHAYYSSIDFDQSIIFTKDFDKDVIKDLERDKSVTKLYHLTVEGSGNMNDTFTLKNTLKS